MELRGKAMEPDVVVYVANQHDSEVANQLVAEVGTPQSGRTAGVRDLYGETLEAVPAVVLEVMRLKKAGTMPLTVADGHPVLSGRLPDRTELGEFLQTETTEPAALVYKQDSAVDFQTESRIHMSWFVNDLEESTRFYEVFFGQPPTKRRADYVKFELEEPPLNLAMSADRKPEPGAGFVNHLGVQLKSTDQIMDFKRRFEEAGFHIEEELETACCYAVQTKIWIGDPDGNRWELFVVTQGEAEEGCGADCPCYAEIAPSVVGGLGDVEPQPGMRVSV